MMFKRKTGGTNVTVNLLLPFVIMEIHNILKVFGVLGLLVCT